MLNISLSESQLMKKKARGGKIACSLCLVEIVREEIGEGAEDEDQNAIEGKKAFNSVVIAKLFHVLSVNYYFTESVSLLQCC